MFVSWHKLVVLNVALCPFCDSGGCSSFDDFCRFDIDEGCGVVNFMVLNGGLFEFG